ncbi:arginine--tRNA ligase [candidate division KSB1 bacterium]|nr:arginine--tRNA ligase [candidate division KSB1 bacterium]
MKPQIYVKKTILQTLHRLGYTDFALDDLVLEKPKQEEFGDFAITIAMNLAKIARKAPRQIAQDIVNELELDPNVISKVEIAGPGFINFFLANPALQNIVETILQEGQDWGKGDEKSGNVLFEFVSANPTGPLNIVSARAAAIGDVLASLFTAVGYHASREFYVNDAGRQIKLLGESLSARYMSALGYDRKVPEEGYHGQYLVDFAREIIEDRGAEFVDMAEQERAVLFSQMALDHMISRQKASLQKYNLQFDRWYHESELRTLDAHTNILQVLSEKQLVYEKEGAVWFKSSEFGDEKDRVLITSQGEPTYFMIDIAYHQTKYNRGFEKNYDLWGPDHHGYINRMSAAMIALGHPADSFQVEIIQQVNLFRGGEVVKMSKRAGEIIEMDELIEEVGVDAARYFFLDRRISQPLDFDIDLAKKQSDENPVYYVQYAHARICNIIRYAEEQGVRVEPASDLSPLQHPSEMALIKKLLDYPDIIAKAAESIEPHRIPNYLHELATAFHRFYHDNRVVSEDRDLTQARLKLCQAARQVLQNGLALLRISAPKTM